MVQNSLVKSKQNQNQIQDTTMTGFLNRMDIKANIEQALGKRKCAAVYLRRGIGGQRESGACGMYEAINPVGCASWREPEAFPIATAWTLLPCTV